MNQEPIFYHLYNVYEAPDYAAPAVETVAPPADYGFLSGMLGKAAKYAAIAGILIIFSSFVPSAWYFVKSGGGEAVSRFLARPVSKNNEIPQVREPQSGYQPRFDASLPKDNRIAIPSIGIDTAVQEATFDSYEEALKKGVWRVPDFGTPFGRGKPVILAAHRYGYLVWSNTFRRKNSFYNLPKLNSGDSVEIVWKQRKYVYQVYGESKGEEVEDYTADLILYTCQDLSSPVRIFKYAKLLEI